MPPAEPGGGSGFWGVESGSSYSIANLSDLTWIQNDITLYHTITSVAVY